MEKRFCPYCGLPLSEGCECERLAAEEAEEKKSSYGKMKAGHGDYRAMGYQDGKKFDPTTRLSGAPERAAIGGGI